MYPSVHSKNEVILFAKGFAGGLYGRESACNARDLGLIPGLGRSVEEGTATCFSILVWRIPKDGGAWQATEHGVPEIRTRLSS